MFCIHCGAPNPEDASFCHACGKAIGAAANPPAAAAAPSRVFSGAEKSSWSAAGHVLPQTPAPVQPPVQPIAQAIAQAPQSQAPNQPAAAGKGKPLVWILVGFAGCLLIVIIVALSFRLSQTSSVQEAPPANPVPDTSAAPAPAADTSTAPAPAADSTPAADSASAPASAPVEAAPPLPAAAPQSPIVGDWKTTTVVGSSIELHFGADGRYTLRDILDSEEGVYVFSMGDGTLRLQPNAVFSHNVVIWSCQLSGDSLSCVDPNGAGHVYTRVQE